MKLLIKYGDNDFWKPLMEMGRYIIYDMFKEFKSKDDLYKFFVKLYDNKELDKFLTFIFRKMCCLYMNRYDLLYKEHYKMSDILNDCKHYETEKFLHKDLIWVDDDLENEDNEHLLIDFETLSYKLI